MTLPEDFVQSMSSLFGDDAQALCQGLTSLDPSVSIRIHPVKQQSRPLHLLVPANNVPWSTQGTYIAERPAFTFDPVWHSGYYYVQEASSMFIEYALRQHVSSAVRVLDMCAAPGGKSISALSMLPEGSVLVSNEIIRSRANILSENMLKYGNVSTIVTNNSPADFEQVPQFFDVILVDAPCSGEGMFRKDENAIAEWSPANVELCAHRQKDILESAWQALAPGGLLLYSTCTFNRLENEDNVRWMQTHLGAESLPIKIQPEWGIAPSVDASLNAYRFFPHLIAGEGLFVSLLGKPSIDGNSTTESVPKRKAKKTATLPIVKDASVYQHYLRPSVSLSFVEQGSEIVAFPQQHTDVLQLLLSKFNVILYGTPVGECKGKTFIPSQALALSEMLHADAFPRAEIDYHTAIAYLRKEAISLPDSSVGFVLVTYKQQPLGWVKNLGSRANNLYPSPWRIRSGYLPEVLPHLWV